MRVVKPVDPHVFWQAEMSDPVEQRSALIFDRTEEEFCRTLSQYPSIGFEDDGKQFGGVFIDQHLCMHIAILPEYQGRWGSLFKQGIDWAFSVSNTLYALVAKENRKIRRFIAHHNWPMIYETEFVALHRITKDTTRILR